LKDQIFIQPRDSNTSLGYTYLNDLNGQPNLILTVETPRDLYNQSMTTAGMFTGALLILALGLFAGTYHFSRYMLRTRRAGQRSLERYQTVVDQSRDAMLLISGDFRILQVNPASRVAGLGDPHGFCGRCSPRNHAYPGLARRALYLPAHGPLHSALSAHIPDAQGRKPDKMNVFSQSLAGMDHTQTNGGPFVYKTTPRHAILQLFETQPGLLL
jgi:hypothetical protein